MKQTRKAKKRTVLCTDSIQWLKTHRNLPSIVTSIPDMNEVNLPYHAYISFLRTAAQLCLHATAEKGYTIFLQTDRKHHGWLDKTYFLIDEAIQAGYTLVWHKIALRKDPGATDLFRPTYSHMLCFTKGGSIGKALPDVVHRGSISYDNAFGIEAVKLAMRYLKQQGIRSVYDVFVGSGTTLAVAEQFGLSSFGIDIDEAQCRKARVFRLPA